MEYADEKILAFINEAEKSQEPKDICAGPVRVGQRYYEFEEQAFFDEKLKVYMPKDFDDMPEQQRKLKYPYEQRPQIIKSDETGAINITLSLIDQELDDESVKELTDGMKALIKRANPLHVFYTDGIEQVNDKPIGFFEFKSSALDEFLYTIMFMFEFEGETILGTFCCPYREYGNWREIAFQVIRTVSIVKGEEQE
ncbi:hypothetical protein GK047_28135 [Paenibacillus sp. SYP-B3998]|uniref:Uncharacterized protein n=1 Tax=Paenibacillus sp. SYP-B3998 TaxID=2678564 RepID=A0A6G4A5P8_9BACL|nr:hypothetical protein [Paenibacillus sp. SYP-B3998]NEW09793.1 hypothetical protein [Paenibacillus sp. SYP-B3998]